MIRIEKLLTKFGLTAVRYSENTGGETLQSVDEQLAAVGIVWHDAPVGFLLLMAECNNDRHALTELMHLVFQQSAQLLTDNWREFYPQQAVTALCVTSVAMAMNQQGGHCPECNGTGRVLRHRKTIKCQACEQGGTPWTDETMFAVFCEQLPVTVERFKQYKSYINSLVKWLLAQRTEAILVMDKRIEEEKAEAMKVA
ncbi:MAG: hypothetical protein CENE_03750 [Candidatus Celerinatantimonas neptuna]|nr:MAG: hypothetical protein CENE_03750 [Candidatus Celerinatantimonas neptuna]